MWRNELHEAVWEGDVEKVRRLGRPRVGIVADGETEERQVSAMLLGCMRGEVRVVDALVRDGTVDVDHLSASGVRCLYYAAATNRSGLVRLLLARGANPCLLDRRHGLSAAHIAAEKGHVGVLRLLLDEFGRTDLVHLPSSDGLLPLHHAVLSGNRDVLLLLLSRHSPLQTAAASGITPLMLAAHLGHGPVCQLLISAGSDVLQRSSVGYAAVHYAARAGRLEVLEVLLGGPSHSLLETPAGPSHETLLHLAASAGAAEAVRLLLMSGASASVRDRQQRTPLHAAALAEAEFAARSVFRDVAELLLAAGADVNAADARLATPLHVLALRGDSENVMWLLAHGADPLRRNADQWTPLDLHPDRALLASLPDGEWPQKDESVPQAALPPPARWEDDADAASCRACLNAFTVLRRRHHCRLCGRIFCNACTSRRLLVSGLPLRVCNACFTMSKSTS